MIKTLLFDFGDVFLDLDKQAPERQLAAFTSTKLDRDLIKTNTDYEQGFINSQEFFKHYKNHFHSISVSGLKKIWNSMLVKFPQHRMDFIEQLAHHKAFNLILLSNTNAWHIEWVQKNFKDYQQFKNCFDAFYLSHEIGMRKPNPEIFKYVLKQHKLNPAEVLFIDDTAVNTAAASKLGLHTWTIDPKTQDIVELFYQKSELF